MKKTLLLLLIIAIAGALSPIRTRAQSVAINADSSIADPSAILDLKSTIKGLLIPRMTMAQRNIIAVPAIGLLVYQTDNTPGFYYYDGALWSPVKGSGGGGGGSDPFWSANGTNINSTNTGNIGIGTTTPIARLTAQTTNKEGDFGLAHAGPNGILLATEADGQTAGIGTFSNTPMRLYTNSKPVMEIDPATGHFSVGIGGTNGEAQMTIFTPPPNGQYGLTHTNGDVIMSTYVGGGTYGAWLGTRSNHDLFFYTNSSPPRLSITKDGHVGVAVEHPGNTFQIGAFAAGQTNNSNSDFVIANHGGSLAVDQLSDRSQFTASSDILLEPRLGDGTGHVGISTYALPLLNKLQIGSMGAVGFNGNDIAIGNGTDATGIAQTSAAFQLASSTNITLLPKYGTPNGRVGINTQNPTAPLDVAGSTTIGNVGYYWYYTAATGSVSNAGSIFDGKPTISIHCESAIFATEYDAFSDARIKDIRGISDAAKDLQTLNALHVTDYTMKDKVRFGNRPFKKVIAQEVEKVYPQVISKHPDFIPNVYTLTDSIEKTTAGCHLHFAAGHHLTPDAKKLRVIPKEQGPMQDYDILSIASPTEVVIAAADLPAGALFVYGQEVADFRTVDYEGLAALNISATQQLSKEVKELQRALATANENIRSMTRMINRLAKPNLGNRLTSSKSQTEKSTSKSSRKI